MNNSAKVMTAYGLSTHAKDGTVLDAMFLRFEDQVDMGPGTTFLAPDVAAILLPPFCRSMVGWDTFRDVEVVPICTRITDFDSAPIDRHDLFLRLFLLSSRRFQPGTLHLGDLEMYLPIAWTSKGPCLPERVEEARWLARASGVEIDLRGIYHVPRMTDYVVPSMVRIINAENVRLGAHLAPGTMVTAAGFVNAGAGTLGPTMVEGRISRGVVVGAGCHIGGGASLMGSTSGGGSHTVTLGRDCLIGANSGVGIALGDGCIVEAGCYITAGSRVTLLDGSIVKAVELAGHPKLLFRRHSVSGALQAVPAPAWPGLKPALHKTGTEP